MSESKKPGFGVIGAGILGEEHALVFSHTPEIQLVAVCDVNGDRAKALAEKYGAPHWYTDYQELLKNPDIQAVSVATPDFAHRDITVAAAQAKKDILLEKPLATSLKDAEEVARAVKAAGVKLMVDYQNRVNPPFVAAKKSVDAGEIGRPAYGYIRLSNTTWVPMEMLSWSSKSSSLWFLGIHCIDMMRWLLSDEVKRVYAVTRSGILKGLGIDTQDFHVAIAEFQKGAVVTFENAWILPRSQPMVYEFKLELLGSEGEVNVNTSHTGAFEKHTGGKMAYGDVLGSTPTGSRRLGGFVKEAIAQFVDAVLYDAPVLGTLEDGLAAVRVADAIERSEASGQPVDIKY
jgi:predicted dehydrogenase